MPKLGKNQEDIQHANRLTVLRLIHRLRCCSRAELARRTGLTKPTITGIVQNLIDAGIVRETGLLDSRAGRKSMGLMMCEEQHMSIGLRLTRRHLRGALCDLGGEAHELRECRIEPGATAEDAVVAMEKMVEELLQSAGSRNVLGIGVAAPGPIAQRDGKILFMSAFPGWEKVPIPETLSERFHLPVLIQHDGVCAALSEWMSRPPEAEYRMMLCVLAGQGIGAGFLADGSPVHGALGCAGEIGHTCIDVNGPKCECGGRGCLESHVSTLVLEREVNEALARHPEHPMHGRRLALRDVLQMVKQGDELIVQIFRKEIEYLAVGIVNLVNILNPDYVFITDELAICDREIEDIVRRVLGERCSPLILDRMQLRVSYGGSFKAVQAAATLPLDYYLQSIGHDS